MPPATARRSSLTRANRDDVDHGDLAGEGTDAALGGECRLAVDDDRDVGGRAAAVAREYAVEAGGAGDQRGTERTGGRPDSTVVIGWCTTSSADSTWPLDFIT